MFWPHNIALLSAPPGTDKGGGGQQGGGGYHLYDSSALTSHNPWASLGQGRPWPQVTSLN